jgi:hypothetical protein
MRVDMERIFIHEPEDFLFLVKMHRRPTRLTSKPATITIVALPGIDGLLWE